MKHLKAYEREEDKQEYILIKTDNKNLDNPYFVINILDRNAVMIFYNEYYYFDSNMNLHTNLETKNTENVYNALIYDIIIIRKSNNKNEIIEDLKQLVTNNKFNI